MHLTADEQSAVDERYSHGRAVAATFYERATHHHTEEQAVRLNIKRRAGESTRGLAINELRVAEMLTNVRYLSRA